MPSASIVWPSATVYPSIENNSGLTAELSDQVETIQKQALRIIFGGSRFTNQSYESFCHNLELSPLSTRRDQLASHFFSQTPTPNQLSSLPYPSQGPQISNGKVKKNNGLQHTICRNK